MQYELTAWISGAILFFVVMLWVLASNLKNIKILKYVALLLIIFFSASYYGVNQIAGIPKYSALPKKFDLIYFYINEPDDIFLWIIVNENNIPLTYRIPYSKDVHERLEETKNLLNYNVPIEGEIIDDPSTGNNSDPTDNIEFDIKDNPAIVKE